MVDLFKFASVNSKKLNLNAGVYVSDSFLELIFQGSKTPSGFIKSIFNFYKEVPWNSVHLAPNCWWDIHNSRYPKYVIHILYYDGYFGVTCSRL